MRIKALETGDVGHTALPSKFVDNSMQAFGACVPPQPRHQSPRSYLAMRTLAGERCHTYNLLGLQTGDFLDLLRISLPRGPS